MNDDTAEERLEKLIEEKRELLYHGECYWRPHMIKCGDWRNRLNEIDEEIKELRAEKDDDYDDEPTKI